MHQFKIEKNIPIGNVSKQNKYPFAKMSVGDSFSFPKKLSSNISSAACTFVKTPGRQGWKFKTKTASAKGRCWRVS